jgi:hypothetical protein
MLSNAIHRSCTLCLVLLFIGFSQTVLATERSKAEGRQLSKPARGEYWPNAPWRNAENKATTTVDPPARQAETTERVSEFRREFIQPVSDNKIERQRMSPDARRELRQQIHQAGKELYR